MPDCAPFFLPGREHTMVANGAVTGCRFVRVHPGVNAVNDLAQCSEALAAVKAYGVAARDRANGEAVLVFRNGVVPVVAVGAIAHGQAVEVGANGRVAVLAAGVRVGVCLADVADGALAKIALELGA